MQFHWWYKDVYHPVKTHRIEVRFPVQQRHRPSRMVQSPPHIDSTQVYQFPSPEHTAFHLFQKLRCVHADPFDVFGSRYCLDAGKVHAQSIYVPVHLGEMRSAHRWRNSQHPASVRREKQLHGTDRFRRSLEQFRGWNFRFHHSAIDWHFPRMCFPTLSFH